MRKLVYFVLLFAFLGNFTYSRDAGAAESSEKKCPRLLASTVWVSDKGKKGSATKLTEAHKNAEAQGWDFAHMSLYIENGDLQGFYVTYTKPHPCNKQ